MYWTFDYYFCVTIYIIYFAIIIKAIVYRVRFLYKYISSHRIALGYRFTRTSFASMSCKMFCRRLPEIPMFGTSYTYWSSFVNIISLRVIVFIPMYTFCYLQEIIKGMSAFLTPNLQTTLRTSCTMKMIVWLLPELPMLFTNYANLSS